MQDETEFLGHTITKEGIKPSAGLTKAICDWPTPKSTKDVQQFLGLAQFYQQYVSGFAQIALPLSSLLANNTPFTWTDKQQAAFLQLKRAISSAPVLWIFDPDLVTIVETDASGFAIGGVLLQIDRHGDAHPIAFTSRKLQSAERNYPTHEQELLAIIHALRTWRYYLDGTKFTVHTDHATLRHFPTQPKLTRRQARWMELLQEYDFDFKYKPGVDNIVPDALSRRPDYRDPDPIELHNLSISLSPDVRDQLVRDYSNDPRLGPIYKDCLDGKVANGYVFQNGLLYFTRRGSTTLTIPSSLGLQRKKQ